jgi:hypothetical protein
MLPLEHKKVLDETREHRLPKDLKKVQNSKNHRSLQHFRIHNFFGEEVSDFLDIRMWKFCHHSPDSRKSKIENAL